MHLTRKDHNLLVIGLLLPFVGVQSWTSASGDWKQDHPI